MGPIAYYKSKRAAMSASRKEEDISSSRQTDKHVLPDLSTPVEQASYVVFDTELTGLKPRKDSIVSIGAIRMTGGTISLGETYYRIVEPRTSLTGKSVVVHGITPTEAAEWPGIETLLPEFLAFCGNSILVGHVVSIDLSFINKDMKRMYGHSIANPAVDTVAIYQWIQKQEQKTCAYFAGSPDDTGLYALARCYGVSTGEAHNALGDAYVTAQLFQRFLGMLPQHGVRTLEDLLRIGRP